jgi:hypothetical protein
MLSPIVTFNEDGTAHIELGGGHLIAHHFYDDTNLTATVVEAVIIPDGFTEQHHRVAGVWFDYEMFGDQSVAYALAGMNASYAESASVFAAIRSVDSRVRSHLHQPARMVSKDELYYLTVRARNLMNIGALSPTPHNLMAHTTKDETQVTHTG